MLTEKGDFNNHFAKIYSRYIILEDRTVLRYE